MNQERKVIEKYQESEKMMILLYAQWCRNNDLSAIELYENAYPDQPKQLLLEMMEWTVPKEEAEPISNETLMSALQAFGNDDLAFIVYEQWEKRKNN